VHAAKYQWIAHEQALQQTERSTRKIGKDADLSKDQEEAGKACRDGQHLLCNTKWQWYIWYTL
jgi:hypothetical protein